jgi:tRNA (guanine-N7-)-methyltransferase
VAAVNRLETLVSTRDLYAEKDASRFPAELTTIQTAYERQWLSRGIDIKYLRLRITPREEWLDSDIEIPLDSYRSYGRDQNSSLQKHK